MSCGLDASSCHVSTRAVRLSFVSTIHCWMAADLSLTERALNRPSRMKSLLLRRGTVLAAVGRTSRWP